MTTTIDSAAHLEIQGLREELEELKQMIREASTLDDLNDLQHKVGPDEAEEAAAIDRLARLDAIDHRCAWEKFEFQCSREELQARQEWNAIMQVQGAYESKYC